MKKICIQGIEGSFHHIVADKVFRKDYKVIACNTFRSLIQKAEQVENDYAIMAIENSIAGSILPNFSLLLHSSLKIVGEYYLPIHQNLLCLQESQLNAIKEVHSHPMALMQCYKYLDNYSQWKLVETDDTALSAQLLAKKPNKSIAVIASTLAAKIYGLKVLAPKIESIKPNITRFLILGKAIENHGADKMTLYIITNHTEGSLSKILHSLAKLKVNLSKIQSISIVNQPFQYGFYLDLEFSNKKQIAKAISKISPLVEELKILGEYKKHHF
ncbi:MAG: prephenate dehydratase [Alphaproteobacteria bacterium]|nr:prephenate dehydratase [Alphaproteobacteria bacterium]